MLTDDVGATADPDATRDVRVALDLLGGDGAPEVVADAAAAVVDRVRLTLVGPPDLAARLLAERGVDPARLRVVPAASAVSMDEDAVRAVRSRPDCTVRVAAELVRDGEADACVSAGHSGAALAAAAFALERLAGVTRPALAVVLPARTGDVVLLDAGGTPDATPDLLAQFALAGSAYAASLGCVDPRVGLLTIGAEAGKGDTLRRDTAALLAELPVRYVGGVEGGDLARGGVADVVVTDGFTGNIVLKALEGAAEVVLDRVAAEYADQGPARRVGNEYATGEHVGAVLLGVDGVSVVGHGASTAAEVEAYVMLAARAVSRRIVPRTAEGLAGLVALRAARSGRPLETA